MAVYYKFKSAKDYDSIPIDGHFVSVLNLKQKIFEKKHLGRGTDFDLVVTNAQTNEEYLDEAMLIPQNTSVLIRRVPGCPRMPIVTEQNKPCAEACKPDDAQPTNSNNVGAGSSVTNYPDNSDWDDFGCDLYAIPEALPVQTSNPVQDAVAPPSKADEDSKIKALIDTPALHWQHQADGFGPGRGYGRGMGGRMMGGRGFGRGGFESRTPPQGYVCFRCNQPGHFIKHCPTNGIPEFDIKRVRPPTGIPKSMLVATPDGSYALPSGEVAVLRPNEAVFEKEIEGLPSTRSGGDFPPEFYCPLCKEVMKDAVLTGKCCFSSFCYKCIRDHFITKSMCVCGANNVLADDLLPNKTLRDSVNRMLESNNSSTENSGSVFRNQDVDAKMEHPRIEQKVPSPTNSATSKGIQAPPPQIEDLSKVRSAVAGQNTTEEIKAKVPDVTEATRVLISVKEHATQGNAPLADNEEQPKPLSGDAGKKKKKKKIRAPLNESQFRNPQDFAMENYMMQMGPCAYNNPYWNNMQPGMEGFLPPFSGPMAPFMGYGPLDVPFGFPPQNPFGFPNMMMPPPFPPPFPPQRNHAELGMDVNVRPPAISREEFEVRKADLKRKRKIESRGERDMSRDREFSKEMSNGGDVSSVRPKSKPLPPPSVANRRRQDRASPPPEHRHRMPEPSAKSAAPPSSVFSRIRFSEGEKKRKSSSSADEKSKKRHYGDEEKKATLKRVYHEKSSDDEDEDRHFKRRPVRYDEERERQRDGSRDERGHRKRRHS